jgi:hypothetical protein
MSSNAAQQEFNYSYTFLDGLEVSGTLWGTQVGTGPNAIVTGVDDVTVNFGLVPMVGTVYADTWNGSTWVSGGVASFNDTLNDFAFANSDLAAGDNTYTQLFYFNSSVAWADNLGVNDINAASATSWSLVADPVPDGGSTAMLAGISVLGLGWLRRKLA